MHIYCGVINRVYEEQSNQSPGAGSIWQTERRDVPHLLYLHLWYVCHGNLLLIEFAG